MRCVRGPRTHVLPYTETPTHKVNTCLVLVSCRGKTVCKKLWVFLTLVDVSLTSLLNDLGDKLITMEGTVDVQTVSQDGVQATSCLKARCHMFVFILSMAHVLKL